MIEEKQGAVCNRYNSLGMANAFLNRIEQHIMSGSVVASLLLHSETDHSHRWHQSQYYKFFVTSIGE
jgi:hypothetical protein